MKKLELLAPAGNTDALKAAVTGGADAVYLGLKDFSARAKADNFDIAGLKSAIDYAHLYGVKVYIAANTLIKDSETELALSLVDKAQRLGADAFIVQDIGFVKKIRDTIPSAVLHASTQMGVHNYLGAAAAEKMGISRVILSRESILNDIKLIKEKTSVEIEAFVHGALCVSFSGNCYFSSLVSSYSGNRGKCLQLCRKKYILNNGKNSSEGYYLSPKDLCLLAELKQLADAGVTSFKIEGRMRRAEYVGEASRIYKDLLTRISDDNYNNEDLSEQIQCLQLMFNRGGYTKGHLLEPTANIIYPSVQNHIGIKAGFVTRVVGGTAYLKTCLTVSRGDGVKFLRKGIETGAGLISTDENMTTFTGSVNEGDEVFITSDKSLIEDIASRTRRIEATCEAEFIAGTFPKIVVEYGSIQASAVGGELISEAKNNPVKREQIKEILESASDADIILHVKKLSCGDNIFVPIGKIKELKKKATALFKDRILENNQKTLQNKSIMSDTALKNSGDARVFEQQDLIFVQTDYIGNLSKEMISSADYIILNPSDYKTETVKRFHEQFGIRSVLNLPNIARGEDISVLRRIVNESGIEIFVINNLFGIELCKDKKIIFGASMNMLNTSYPCERINSIESERFNNDCINIVYGKLPLMTLTHCIKKQDAGKCEPSCGGYNNYKLIDEMNNSFHVRRVKMAYCYAQLINPVPLYLGDFANIYNARKRLIDFTGHTAAEAKEAFDLLSKGRLPEKYTRGNYNKTLK